MGQNPTRYLETLIFPAFEIFTRAWSWPHQEGSPGELVTSQRAFGRLCAELQPGDTLVVTKLDRFARTETEAYELVMKWVKQGVRVRVLNLGTIEDTEI